MKDRSIEKIIGAPEQRPVAYGSLMHRRVNNILLVSSAYDFFTFEQDGRLAEALYSDYLALNLRQTPTFDRASTAADALRLIERNHYDLVISMLRVGEMEIGAFAGDVRQLEPDMPVLALAYNTRELEMLERLDRSRELDRSFVWLGDVRLFLAMVKYIEDRLNVYRDVRTADIQCILLVEDSIRFYSSYLPMLYTELVAQTQDLMSDALNHADRMLRMRARPKLLLATTYEEGQDLLERYEEHVACVILDAGFPVNGVHDKMAGRAFASMVREQISDRPVLIQSTLAENERWARELGAEFIHKLSPNLLAELRAFMRSHLGFGDFVFRREDGTELSRAHDLRSMAAMLRSIPDEALARHSRRNDFSTWLMARTEFEAARKVRPRSISDFESLEELRRYLVETLEAHRGRIRAGKVADFSTGTFEPASGFVRIDRGSLGGKGRGLAFFNTIIEHYHLSDKVPGVEIRVPPTAVLATDVFDEFMSQGRLKELALAETNDAVLDRAFLDARLPRSVKANLSEFLSRTEYPLAVRSSSLLEDASFQPFAGIYATYMIPNNHPDLGVRLAQLEEAIKLVYASTYSSAAKAYIDSTPSRLEEEKMAVVIQQVVGRKRGDHFYPDVAGVARSYNFYPMEGMDAHEGVASVVLGLGKAVVEGGRCVRFSPAQPHRLYQFSSPDETLRSAQRELLALDVSNDSPRLREAGENAGIVRLGLEVAERDGILHNLASTYSHENHSVYDGTSRPGVRLVTLAGVLKSDVFPLAETLSLLLDVTSAGFSSPIEIEFAANMSEAPGEPHEFAFLQARPVVVALGDNTIRIEDTAPSSTICVSEEALGHGMIEGVRDIVYVPRGTFDRSKTVEIAGEIGAMTSRLNAEDRSLLLIGPGRWGSADRWLGIPVSWQQIRGVKCIVETDMEDIKVAPSQGTHFFQNITSFGIGYLSVNVGDAGGSLDLEWLDAQPAVAESEHVRHLRFDDPLVIAINARQRAGVVLKPGHTLEDTR